MTELRLQCHRLLLPPLMRVCMCVRRKGWSQVSCGLKVVLHSSTIRILEGMKRHDFKALLD